MKSLKTWMNGMLMAMTFGLGVDSSTAAFPEESIAPLKESQRLAAIGDWSGAIDAYSDHLSKLSTQNYRDKKTYEWILVEYLEDEQGNIEQLKELLEEKLQRIDRNQESIMRWRLHQLLARIAEKQNDSNEQHSQLLKAIKAYPTVEYAAPSKHSKLQHLYNEAALLKAHSNVEEAESWLIQSYLTDSRFEFPFVPAWKQFYEEQQQPEQYQALLQRFIDAVEKQSANSETNADFFTYLNSYLENELSRAKGE